MGACILFAVSKPKGRVLWGCLGCDQLECCGEEVEVELCKVVYDKD